MSVAAAFKSLIADCPSFIDLVNPTNDPLVDPADFVYQGETPGDINPPFAVFAVNMTTASSGTGDSTSYIPTGTARVILCVANDDSNTFAEEAERVTDLAQDIAGEAVGLSLVPGNPLIQSVEFQPAQRSDETMRSPNESLYWTVEFSFSLGLGGA